MPHNPRHGADPGVIIGGGSSSTSSPPSQPSSPQDYFGSMFTAPGSSTANVTGTSEEADKGTSGPGIFGFSGGSGGGSGGGSSGGQGTDTSGSGTDTSGSGTDTSGSNQGTDSSDTGDEGEGIDDIFFKIFTGPEIEQLSPDRLKRAKSVLSQYISLGETNPLKLRTLMASNVLGGIFGEDQTVSDMEGKIVKPEDAFNLDGTLKEGLRYTKEGIIKLLDEDQEGGNILESLKKFNPELYYPFMGMPATSGSLVDLAKIPVTEEMQGTNPELAKMIFDARMELDRMGKNPMTGESQGQGEQGITSIPSSGIKQFDVPGMGPYKPFTGPYSNIPQQYAGFFDSPFNKPVAGGMAITPVQLPDGSTIEFGDTGSAAQFQQYLDSIGVSYSNPRVFEKIAGTPATGVPAVFNYASIAPQFTGSPYTNQGVSPAFLENLRRFYG